MAENNQGSKGVSNDTELQEFAQSPNYSHQVATIDSSRLSAHQNDKRWRSPVGSSESRHTTSTQATTSSSPCTSDSGASSSSKLKRRLGQLGSLMKHDISASPPLADTKSKVEPENLRSSVIQKADKVFSVTRRDASVLERVGHRAQHAALRVRKPHEVFVELEEIHIGSTKELEWEETARWIKFEEDVEEGSGRWGRPHVSALAFHSLVEVRQGLETGCVLLDAKGHDYPTVVDGIVKSLVELDLLPNELLDQVRRLLLKKRKHPSSSLWDKLRQTAADSNLLRSRRPSSDNTSKNSNDHTHLQKPPLVLHSHSSPVPFEILEEDNSTVQPNNSSILPTKDTMVHVSSAPAMFSATQGPPDISDNSKKVTFTVEVNSDFSAHTSADSANDNSQPNSTHQDHTSFSNQLFARQDHTPLDEQKIEIELEMEADSAYSEMSTRDGNDPVTSTKRPPIAILDKIPEEAESLTVLVGGVNFLKQPITAFIRLKHGLDLDELTEVPIPLRFIFLQIGPDNQSRNYHEVGRAMATLMSDKCFHEVAYSAVSKEDLLEAMDEFLDDSIVLPPGDWDEDLLLSAMHEKNAIQRQREDHKEAVKNYDKLVREPMKHSRRFCGGLWKDLKNLASRYPSDIKDSFNLQVLVSIFFLYISFLAPAIAFGGLMEEITGNQIGETETLLATGLGGIVVSLFAVQPLTVLAFTGPVIVYEDVIFDLSRTYGVSYLEWRALIGLWMMCILLILAVTELTFIVHLFTRFSEEIFIGIISAFFIYEAGINIYYVFKRNPLCGIHYPCGENANRTNTCTTIPNDTNMSGLMMMMSMMDENTSMVQSVSLPSGFRICNQPNTALMSLILCLSTFIIALFLRTLRFKKFLGKKTRRLVSDFGMLVAITSMVLVAFLISHLVSVEGLLVPPNYSVSDPSVRGWFINPFNGSLSVGEGFGAIVPAILFSILIFVENQLALIFVNNPEHKLTKPVGYHIDLFLVSILSGVAGLIGIPFLCGAPVRSIQHLQALSVFTKKHAPGEKPGLVKIHEQRLTSFAVHVLIIVTPFASVVLERIPISVVLGVFFYLGFVSLSGIQVTNRIKLFFILPKYHPNAIYVRKVRTWKMHIYTLIQVFCVALLFAVKLSEAAVSYPLIIVLLIPLKWILGKTIFNKEEMEALDNEENAKPDHADVGEFEFTHAPY